MIFGGYNAEGLLSDVWEFDLEAREWARADVAAGPVPPERTFFRGDFDLPTLARHQTPDSP